MLVTKFAWRVKMLKKAALFSFLFIFIGCICHAQTVVVLKNGSVYRYDATTGAYKGTVGSPGAIAASSDGEIIAIVNKNGHVSRHTANGAYKGQVGRSKAVGVQVAGGVITVTYQDGSTARYDAKTGAYKGTF